MDEVKNKDVPFDIEERTYQFALRIVKLCRHLESKAGVKRTLGNQLLRSGTSIGANVEEARAVYSRAEFVCKMSIALKEARETRYWIRLLTDSQIVESSLLHPLLSEATEVMKIIGAITSKSRKSSS